MQTENRCKSTQDASPRDYTIVKSNCRIHTFWAEGKDYYEKVLNDPAQMLEDIVFEPLLNIADDAFEIKMNVPFNYMPTYNYETQSNKSGWQLTQ